MSSIISSEVTAGTSAVILVNGDADGRAVIANNISNATVYVGSSSVTTSNGWPIVSGATLAFNTPASESLYVIAAEASKAVRVLILDN